MSALQEDLKKALRHGEIDGFDENDLGEQLGAGEFGTVFALGSNAVVKIANGNEDVHRMAFRHEREAYQALHAAGVPNVAKLGYSGLCGGKSVMVVEPRVDCAMDAKKDFQKQTLVQVTLPALAETVAGMIKCRRINTIDPAANILINEVGYPLVIDWGHSGDTEANRYEIDDAAKNSFIRSVMTILPSELGGIFVAKVEALL
jgi:hypothetical protein